MSFKRLLLAAIPILVAAAILIVAPPKNGRAQESAVSAAPRQIRLATYNLEWFSEDANPQRIANLKSVLANVKADVIGLQEVQSLKALRQILGDEWQIGIKDEPKEFQELAIAVRKPLRLESWEMVFPGPALDLAFPGGRDVIRAVVVPPSGKRLVVYVCHMKSRRGGRANTDFQREMAAGLLAAYVRGRRDEPLVVVLGDMNDAPDDVSLNILETGNLFAKGGRAPSGERILINLAEPLYDQDHVSFGLEGLFNGEPIEAKVEGAKAENEKWRGKNPSYPDDLVVTQILFDQILVSPALAQTLIGQAKVYSGSDALRGQGGRVIVEENGSKVTYQEKGDQASDHLPVYADVKL
jgi:endonuclease/exonuclease/phosphatase family metal-dependent hydrolase